MDIANTYNNRPWPRILLKMIEKEILTSRDVMSLLCICENTLLKYEKLGEIKVDFRIGNRKRYYRKNLTRYMR